MATDVSSVTVRMVEKRDPCGLLRWSLLEAVSVGKEDHEEAGVLATGPVALTDVLAGVQGTRERVEGWTTLGL